MEDAIEAVQSETYSISQAAVESGVPGTTLWRRLIGLNSGKRGRPYAFTDDEEHCLEELVTHCARLGVPISRILFLKVARQYAKDQGKYTLPPS